MDDKLLKPDYIFETSWEVCNKVGGIHTVVSTKALTLVKEYKDNLILIGPDVWRETRNNPEFTEDKKLFSTWRKRMAEEGIKVKIGRWNIVGKPVVFLVDFSPFFSLKNEIFSEFWTTYQLDSLSGQWDYIEPATFGYAAGKVIESFNKYQLNIRDKVVAHFHEWMTGTGILYLKSHAPQIATLFTTHATAVGRSIAGNRQPLYKNLNQYNGDAKAREFNIISKHSLEKITAHASDCFTTVSDLTAAECSQFLEKPADIVTPNGFEDNFVPQADVFAKKRADSRAKLKQVAEAVLGYELADDVKFVGTSGRYEFWNKGIDAFIDAMGSLNHRERFNKDIVAWVLVPANNYGPRRDLIERLNGNDKSNTPLSNRFMTHNLHDSEYDPTLNRLKELGITNGPEQHAKVIFVPSYLNGEDGIFNIGYYDCLIGLDLTVFPSYYEPWGYTPLESLAFHVPTVTTTLAGFGLWVKSKMSEIHDCVGVVERNDENYPQVVEDIANRIILCSYKAEEEIHLARENAYFVSRTALWKNLINYYKEAYSIALSQVAKRNTDSSYTPKFETLVSVKKPKSQRPNWRVISVQPNLPMEFKGLEEISMNLWWSWNYEARELFEMIGTGLFKRAEYNPVKLLKEVSIDRFNDLKNNNDFVTKYRHVYSQFNAYMAEKPKAESMKIAYFSMEFGLAAAVKIYSGGLGILAGDYLKQASDQNVQMVGVGLLYRYGYFTQKLSVGGEQMAIYDPQNFSELPVHKVTDANGDQVTVRIIMPGRSVYVQVWRVQVGRIPLYLLDTDFERNSHEDRTITHYLYGGDNEMRLKQEIVLGIGGIRALNLLGIHQNIFHINEGHAAFIGIERLREFIQEKNFTFAESLELVRASSLFTTHTPVAAGHDAFPEELIMTYMGHYPERLRISWEEFINLGKHNPTDKHEKFSMSQLAISASQEVNAVSWLHGKVTREMFTYLWDGYTEEELYIGYVTNGVHYPTWTSRYWRKLYEKHFGKDFDKNLEKRELWNKIYTVPDAEIWTVRQQLRSILFEDLLERLSASIAKRHEDPRNLLAIKSALNKDVLTIGFARRFATYKRAYLLFQDTERLSAIVNNPDMPVQFLFAGKAHPADVEGQELIEAIVEISHKPEFIGKVVFIENYDMELASRMVQGVDVWLNTPTRPLEASGTSGMKAVMNGVLNFSVLDGWWVEGYKDGAGWSLPEERTFQNQQYQNELDSDMIYNTLENEIIPMFYDRDSQNIPLRWIQYIKNCIANITPDFTTKRMLDDYIERFYSKLFTRTKLITANDYELAQNIASWKKRMSIGWESVEIISINTPDIMQQPLVIGEEYTGDVVIDLKELPLDSVGMELLMVTNTGEKTTIVGRFEMVQSHVDGKVVTFSMKLQPSLPGMFNYGIRMYPKHELLPHRQDFGFVRWI